MVANHLVATPRPLNHLDGLSVCEAAVALGTGVRWCDEGLVGLAVGTAKEIGKVAAGLRHGDPGVTACWGVVEGAATHLDVDRRYSD
jgi:hypothetical protein